MTSIILWPSVTMTNDDDRYLFQLTDVCVSNGLSILTIEWRNYYSWYSVTEADDLTTWPDQFVTGITGDDGGNDQYCTVLWRWRIVPVAQLLTLYWCIGMWCSVVYGYSTGCWLEEILTTSDYSALLYYCGNWLLRTNDIYWLTMIFNGQWPFNWYDDPLTSVAIQWLVVSVLNDDYYWCVTIGFSYSIVWLPANDYQLLPAIWMTCISNYCYCNMIQCNGDIDR